jgi:predicted nucleotidyltransferase/DNA-binding transcriptional regulator YiaG
MEAIRDHGHVGASVLVRLDDDHLQSGRRDFAAGARSYLRSAIVVIMTRVRSGTASTALHEARQRAGLSQTELARRAAVTQSVISAYESGARQPSLPVLERLVAATGLELELRVRKARSPLVRLSGPLGRKVRAQRAEIKRLAAKAGVTNLRVFGSVACGQETASSDIDLLVDLSTDTGLFTLAALRGKLERLLEAKVDLVPADSLKDDVRQNALRDAVNL